jgi:hypothetical protein
MESPKPAKPALNFVEDESNAAFFGQLAKILEQLCFNDANAAFALHRLNYYGCN